jgi:hemoglobin
MGSVGKQTNVRPQGAGPKQSLYDRVGDIFPIAAVIDYFSDEIIKDPVAGAGSANPQLRQWHTKRSFPWPGRAIFEWTASKCSNP